MVELSVAISLVGYALGALGGSLVFIEFFQTPNYISYRRDWDTWRVQMNPKDVAEFTWAGRIGALLMALAFALQFVAGLLP